MSTANPFDLDWPQAYAAWRQAKLADRARQVGDLVVEVNDPRNLSLDERQALLQCCARNNMAIYRGAFQGEDKSVPRLMGAQLGLHRLDANWLADEDGISPIAVAEQRGERNDFIPYTDRQLGWHTDGYYYPQARRIEGMLLHCVRAASQGGVTVLADPDMLYIALRDANPAWIKALCAADAMTIPEREAEGAVVRPTQSGPVFSQRSDGGLHLRYTGRTRSIAWKDDAHTREAVSFIEQLLADNPPWVYRLTLEPGMGLVSNNVLHGRSSFTDDPAQPRLLYRARYLDCIAPMTQALPLEIAS